MDIEFMRYFDGDLEELTLVSEQRNAFLPAQIQRVQIEDRDGTVTDMRGSSLAALATMNGKSSIQSLTLFEGRRDTALHVQYLRRVSIMAAFPLARDAREARQVELDSLVERGELRPEDIIDEMRTLWAPWPLEVRLVVKCTPRRLP